LAARRAARFSLLRFAPGKDFFIAENEVNFHGRRQYRQYKTPRNRGVFRGCGHGKRLAFDGRFVFWFRPYAQA